MSRLGANVLGSNLRGCGFFKEFIQSSKVSTHISILTIALFVIELSLTNFQAVLLNLLSYFVPFSNKSLLLKLVKHFCVINENVEECHGLGSCLM